MNVKFLNVMTKKIFTWEPLWSWQHKYCLDGPSASISYLNPHIPSRRGWSPMWLSSCSRGCPPCPASTPHTLHPAAAVSCKAKGLERAFWHTVLCKAAILLFRESWYCGLKLKPVFIKDSHLCNVGLGRAVLLSVRRTPLLSAWGLCNICPMGGNKHYL